MKTHLINPKDAIAAFQIITDKGTHQGNGNGYLYKGIMASSDIDGYTVFLQSTNVELTVYYHYKYKLDYQSKADLEQFKIRLEGVLAER